MVIKCMNMHNNNYKSRYTCIWLNLPSSKYKVKMTRAVCRGNTPLFRSFQCIYVNLFWENPFPAENYIEKVHHHWQWKLHFDLNNFIISFKHTILTNWFFSCVILQQNWQLNNVKYFLKFNLVNQILFWYENCPLISMASKFL